MPHVIIEYPHDIVPESQVTKLLDAVHQSVISSNLFEVEKIKTRAVPILHYRVGSNNSSFVHAQLRIHSGRNETQKKKLSEIVLQALQSQELPVNVVTVEVVDMDRASYARYPE